MRRYRWADMTRVVVATALKKTSSIIKIAKPPSRHLEKSHNNNTQPRLTPRSRLLEYCVDWRHLAAHRATTSSSRAIFKFQLFLGHPSYCRILLAYKSFPWCGKFTWRHLVSKVTSFVLGLLLSIMSIIRSLLFVWSNIYYVNW
jgi:hypothetical protein